MIKYYKGSVRHHAVFWVEFRDLPADQRFSAFLDFYRLVKHEVDSGKCTLREAGYALKPGFYDDDIYGPHEFVLTFAQDAVEDLIIVAQDNPEEAKNLWLRIVDVMGAYL